jgi:hypothetical protein
VKSSVSFGDLAQAVRVLQPEDKATLAAMVAIIDPSSAEAPAAKRTITPIVIPPPVIPPPRGPFDPEERTAEALADSQFYPIEIESEADRHAPLLRMADASQPLTLSGSERDEPRPELPPLLRPQSKRAILSAALATNIPSGIDIGRTIELLARCQPLERLPVRVRRSVRRGVQLLLDKGSGMAPFLADQGAMTEWIRNVIGAQRVQVASFIGSPKQGLLEGLHKRLDHAFPAGGTPVVLLTDLGIARPPALDEAASVDEWLAFAQGARLAGCPVLAFVPYPPARWPRALRRAMTILQWDRALTAGQAAKGSRG